MLDLFDRVLVSSVFGASLGSIDLFREKYIISDGTTVLVMSLPSRYSFTNLVKAMKSPELFLVEGRRLALSVNAAYSRLRGLDGKCSVPDEDWDNLIILDGCRYDLFEEMNTLNGTLESRISPGSESWEYLRENFEGRQMHDTVYVTANPYAPRLSEDTFYLTVNLLEDQWDETLKTVPPGAVTAEAIKIHQEYPNKRLIVHYMQPHFPFIGETGREISHAGVVAIDETDRPESPHVWGGLQDDVLEVDEETVIRAYRENLELTLPHVEELVRSVNGMSVVTADHGNLIGERTAPIPVKGYGHPRGFYAPGLVTVPWHIVEMSEHRTIKSDPPLVDEQVDSQLVEERLADLGYR